MGLRNYACVASRMASIQKGLEGYNRACLQIIVSIGVNSNQVAAACADCKPCIALTAKQRSSQAFALSGSVRSR